jgi:large subunit ribosomal protein L6
MEEIEITVPENVQTELEGTTLKVTGAKGTITRVFKAPSIHIKTAKGVVSVSTPSGRKKDLATLGTVRSHITNMIRGVQEGYEYKLRIFYAHFPVNISVDDDMVKIDNFLGEKYPRYARIIEGCQVKVQGDIIVVSGIDKEGVGQTAANLEQATRIKKKDPRVFQDGIYLFERDGVKLR